MSKNTQQAAPTKIVGTPNTNLNVTGLSVVAKDNALPRAEDAKFEVIEEPKKRTISDVIKFVQNKTVILQKLEILNQTEKNLDSFNLGTDGVKDTLQIVDGEGNKFQTNNTPIIEKVIQVLKSEIEMKRENAEKELALEL